jgi:hypothetical protein
MRSSHFSSRFSPRIAALLSSLRRLLLLPLRSFSFVAAITSVAVVPLVVCFLVASGLWIYASLREDYAMTVELPLEIKLPTNRTIETALPAAVRVRVQGTGWSLLNMNLAGDPRCVVFFSDKRFAAGAANTLRQVSDEQVSVQCTRAMMRQAMQIPAGVQVLDVLSEPFTTQIGVIEERKVPIVPVLNITPREGFIVTGVTSIVPDSVVIRGNKQMLAAIAALGGWKTKLIALRDVYEPLSVQTPLSDTLAGLVEIPLQPSNSTASASSPNDTENNQGNQNNQSNQNNQNNQNNQSDAENTSNTSGRAAGEALAGQTLLPTITVSVQQMAELSIPDVPVQLVAAPLQHRLVVAPTHLRIVVRGGAAQIAKLLPSDITASVDYASALASSTGRLRPRIMLPPEVYLVESVPAQMQCVVRRGAPATYR